MLDTYWSMRFPQRSPGEMSIVVVFQENGTQVQRDLYYVLDVVRRLLEADVGRV